jgi:hypothetical protein
MAFAQNPILREQSDVRLHQILSRLTDPTYYYIFHACGLQTLSKSTV